MLSSYFKSSAPQPLVHCESTFVIRWTADCQPTFAAFRNIFFQNSVLSRLSSSWSICHVWMWRLLLRRLRGRALSHSTNSCFRLIAHRTKLFYITGWCTLGWTMQCTARPCCDPPPDSGSVKCGRTHTFFSPFRTIISFAVLVVELPPLTGRPSSGRVVLRVLGRQQAVRTILCRWLVISVKVCWLQRLAFSFVSVLLAQMSVTKKPFALKESTSLHIYLSQRCRV